MNSGDILQQFFSEEINKITHTKEDEEWREEPAAFREFVVSKSYMGMPPLTEIQYTDVETFLGIDPKLVFRGGSNYNIFCLLAGKGSGKDYLASFIITYCYYLLLCMKSPHDFLNWPKGESIDLLIVSYSGDQALKGPFDKIIQRFKNCFWFTRNFTIVWSDRGVINQKGKPEITVQVRSITSFNNVRILCEHSKNEAFEGFNVLVFLMSEASAFQSQTNERNADRVYSTLRTSANTRFPGKTWKGMIVSWPRADEDNDFTMHMYHKEAPGNPTIWARKTFSWDYKPARLHCGEKFEYVLEGETFLIPIELKEDFDKYPDDSRAKHLCQPIRGGRRPFDPNLILNSIHSRAPLLEFEQRIEDNLVRLKITGHEIRMKFIEEYMITVDLGKMHSAAALALQHFDKKEGYILDAIGAWTPEKDATVDFLDVEYWLEELAQAIPNVRIGFDQWNSELYKARLENKGFRVFTYHVRQKNGQDYDMFQKAMGSKMVHLLNHKIACQQLSAIKVDADGEIFLDKKISIRKDHADVIVGGFMVFLSEMSQILDSSGGQYINSNLHHVGGQIIGRNI